MLYTELENVMGINFYNFDTYTIDGSEPKPTRDLIGKPDNNYMNMHVVDIRKVNDLFNIALRSKLFFDFKFIEENDDALWIEFKYENKVVRMEIIKQYYTDDDGTIVDYEANLDDHMYNFYVPGYDWQKKHNGFVYEDETDESSVLYDLVDHNEARLITLLKEVLEFINTLKK